MTQYYNKELEEFDDDDTDKEEFCVVCGEPLEDGLCTGCGQEEDSCDCDYDEESEDEDADSADGTE